MPELDKSCYTAYYCEENIWQLSHLWNQQSPGRPAAAVFISNVARQCALWQQIAAPSDEPVIWDYHVVMMAAKDDAWNVLDFDSRLSSPCLLADYLEQTFREDTASQFQPQFRVVTCHEFVDTFSSDRRHMRTKDGSWRQPVPAWPAIYNGRQHNLDQFIDMRKPGPGVVYDLDQLRHNPVI